jgi:osmotically-inducible protein OsmY
MTLRKTTTHSRHLAGLAVLLGSALLVSACAPLVIGGAMVGGALVATDRRTSGTQLEDQAIELKTSSRIRDAVGDRTHINVVSYNRAVVLTGEAPTEADRASAERAARTVENVRSVLNEVAIMGPSSLGSRSNDTLVTTRVKASLVDAKDIQGTAMKVVTERGIVYLLGRVTEREAAAATAVARGVPGVLKVVRIFEILSEAELAALGATPSTTAPKKAD